MTFEKTSSDFAQFLNTNSIEESGCAFAVMLIKNNEICCGIVGDCRCQIMKYDKEWCVTEWANVHRLSNPVEMERIAQCEGELKQFEDQQGNVQGHTRLYQKNERKPGLVATRVFGSARLQQLGVTAQPDMYYKRFDECDKIFFVGSDGLFEYMEYLEVAEILIKNQEKKDIVKACIEVCAKADKNYRR